MWGICLWSEMHYLLPKAVTFYHLKIKVNNYGPHFKPESREFPGGFVLKELRKKSKFKGRTYLNFYMPNTSIFVSIPYMLEAAVVSHR